MKRLLSASPLSYPGPRQIPQKIFAALPGAGNQEMAETDCADHSLAFRNRSALPMTDTELKLMAAPAMMGLKSKPKNG